MSYPHLATRLYNAPLLITPGKAEVIEQVFRAYCEGRGEPGGPPPSRKELQAPGVTTRADGGYLRTQSGVALIPIVGTLVQRADSMDAMSGLIGYNRIASQLQAALDDPRVDAILLEIDSNGGEAAGLMDLAGKVSAARTKKPTWAIANEGAFSAAYWLASATGRVSAPESGMVGSIGVVMMHVDQSGKDAKAGIKYTPVFAGDRKVDFSSHAPLSDAAMQTAQDEVDRVYGLFVDAISANRKMAPQAVRDTQAGLFHAKAAVDLKLIDAVESFDATLAALEAEAQRFRFYGPRAATSARVPQGDTTMTANADKPAAPAGAAASELTEAQKRGFEEGKGEGAKAGSDAERTRISAILTHAEAEGRSKLAQHLAFKTTQSVEDAAAMLAAAPKEVAAKDPTNRFAAAMDAQGNPNLVPDGAASNNDAAGDAGKPSVPVAANIYKFRRECVAKARAAGK